MHEPTEVFVGFAHALQAAGLRVAPDRTQMFVDACARLDAGSQTHVYWAGRATLCTDPADIPVYDKTFERWFAARATPAGQLPSAARTVSRAALEAAAGAESGEGERQSLAVLASAEEVLRRRDIADLDADERRRLARLFDTLTVRIPQRRSIRRTPAHRGAIDAAATVREQLRRAGEPGPLRHRRARLRPRRIVLLIDVSGSMQPYSDSLLRLAHRVVVASPRTTEVFTLGTALTRVTPALRQHDVQRALRMAAEAIPDWSGGTRLGEGLRAFLDGWGQRGAAHGAVVVIASDGWEVGDATLLAAQMRRLRHIARTILWSNPHRGKNGYAPIQSGIVAALPSLDALVAGHSMTTFARLLEMVADA